MKSGQGIYFLNLRAVFGEAACEVLLAKAALEVKDIVCE